MIVTALMVIGGLILLVAGGELLVRGAVALAERLGVTPLVIGLVIVGFGTSMPELVTSVEAAMAGSPAIAWGNIVGSNIANTLLILGAAAVLAPIAIRQGAALRDTGVALVATLALAGIAWTGLSGLGLGLALLASLIVYVGYCYREERVQAPEVIHNAPYDRSLALELADPTLHQPASPGWLRPVLLTLAGLAVLVVGGRLLVTGAIDLAQMAGLSETLIGLTIVAIGTSLPELVTSVIAARKGEPEVAFGNVVGSNIYNILGIGGVTMMVAPQAIPADLLPFDIGIMALSAVAVMALAWFLSGVNRIAGIALVLGYAAFLALLVATA
ncbi:sodium:calcium antiporter [Erythrobacter sp. QSSC1-22B]|uniref:calcium/sodium antiporter n=1 Tax=Erythrobacter sp. QSSC1-22B TaxID=1860125 RepID=UPI00080599CD|nr:calcium/sodium antiporter [Erythrobacter sp. QSSC1-22B]OBX19182.1 sodium:calcium antiporter [Erythrobacter sp. QSSC1-22B]